MSFLGLVIRLPILVYRYALSPLFPGTCRFQPTCSAYALEAVERHGAWGGTVLALKRIFRCHPWGGSGYDAVPGPLPLAGCRRVPPAREQG